MSTSRWEAENSIRRYLPDIPYQRNAPARRHTHEEWESHRHLITEYYNRMILKDLIKFMADHHGFLATTNQYKKKFSDWEVRKNEPSYSERVMDWMLQTMWERYLQGKETVWRLAGGMCDDKKMRRLFRSQIDKREEEQRLLPAEPISPCPGLSPLTPEVGKGCAPKAFSELLPRILPRVLRRSSAYAPPHTQVPEIITHSNGPSFVPRPPRRAGTEPMHIPTTFRPALTRSERETLASEFNAWLGHHHGLEGDYDVGVFDNQDPRVLHIVITCRDCGDAAPRTTSAVTIPPGTFSSNAAAQLRSYFYALARRFHEEHVSRDFHQYTVSSRLEEINRRTFSYSPPMTAPQSYYGDKHAALGIVTSNSWRPDQEAEPWWSPTTISPGGPSEELEWSGFLNSEAFEEESYMPAQYPPRNKSNGPGMFQGWEYR